jgi:phosphoribosylaminoimidazolecarboxamide formyltransferase/IMP cyclohydrolase
MTARTASESDTNDMSNIEMRYGINPHQVPASMEALEAGSMPFEIINGAVSYVNVLDALNGWQLVREASAALGTVVAASFKHVSPAGVARAGSLDEVIRDANGLGSTEVVDEVTSAYLRARDADPKSAYGDLIAISHDVTRDFATRLSTMVSDGIIAPGFEPGAVDILRRKKQGRYLVMRGDTAFVPPARESREAFGVRLTQPRDTASIDREMLVRASPEELPRNVVDDMLLGLISVRFTQSNSVAYVRDGVTLGIGAGQQSRVDCTRMAGAKVDTWWLRRSPSIVDMRFTPAVKAQERINWRIRCLDGDLTIDERLRLSGDLASAIPELSKEHREEWLGRLDGVSFVSDGFLPFRDNVDHARKHGVEYIAEPGGSIRSGDVARACAELGVKHVETGLRLFHH